MDTIETAVNIGTCFGTIARLRRASGERWADGVVRRPGDTDGFTNMNDGGTDRPRLPVATNFDGFTRTDGRRALWSSCPTARRRFA
jgi:hypothetical protein